MLQKYFKEIFIKLFFCYFLHNTIIFAHAISNDARYIKHDETWTGTISILDDTVVEENVILTVEADTKVIFYVSSPQEPPRIIIRGKLNVKGTKKKIAIFTSSQDALLNPVEDKNKLIKSIVNFFSKKKSSEIKFWGGIHFENIRDNGSSINYCNIEFAKDGVVCNNSSPLITNSVLKNCKESGIRCNLRSNPIIINNTFTNNPISGIYCHQESSPEIISNIFKNLPYGIICLQTAPKKIANNTFIENEKAIYCHFPGASPLITENIFNKNENAVFCEQGPSPVIENNKFNENKKAIYLQRLSYPRITGNKFNKNEFSIYCFQNSSPVINNNEFLFNKIGIFVYYASYPTIKENFLDESNEYAIKVGKQSYVLYQELIAGGKKTKIGIGRYAPRNPGKNFSKTKPDIQQKFTDVDVLINAKNNYWGKNITKIMNENGSNENISSIYDGYDEPEFEFEGKKYPYDKVDYSGWLLKWEKKE